MTSKCIRGHFRYKKKKNVGLLVLVVFPTLGKFVFMKGVACSAIQARLAQPLKDTIGLYCYNLLVVQCW